MGRPVAGQGRRVWEAHGRGVVAPPRFDGQGQHRLGRRRRPRPAAARAKGAPPSAEVPRRRGRSPWLASSPRAKSSSRVGGAQIGLGCPSEGKPTESPRPVGRRQQAQLQCQVCRSWEMNPIEPARARRGWGISSSCWPEFQHPPGKLGNRARHGAGRRRTPARGQPPPRPRSAVGWLMGHQSRAKPPTLQGPSFDPPPSSGAGGQPRITTPGSGRSFDSSRRQRTVGATPPEPPPGAAIDQVGGPTGLHRAARPPGQPVAPNFALIVRTSPTTRHRCRREQGPRLGRELIRGGGSASPPGRRCRRPSTEMVPVPGDVSAGGGWARKTRFKGPRPPSGGAEARPQAAPPRPPSARSPPRRTCSSPLGGDRPPTPRHRPADPVHAPLERQPGGQVGHRRSRPR